MNDTIKIIILLLLYIMFNINLKEVFISSITMLLVDSIYLFSLKNYFNSVFKKIQNADIKIKYLGLILCYLVLIFGINYFIISKKRGLINSFLLGFTIYAVYETTNYATLNNWPFTMVIIDSLWGGLLFMLTTFITYKISNEKIKLIN